MEPGRPSKASIARFTRAANTLARSIDVESLRDSASVAGRIRAAIKSRGITQREVARRMGITEAGFSNMLRHKHPLPDTLRRVSEAIAVPLSKLKEGAD